MTDNSPEAERRSSSLAARQQCASLVSGLVHELRTPLASQGLIIEMLARNSDAEWKARNTRSLNQLKDLTREMQTLIADAGRMATLLGDRVPVRTKSVSLRGLLERVEEALRARGWKRGVTVSSSLAADLPDHVNTDPQLFEECLLAVFDIALVLAHDRVSARAAGDGDQVRVTIRSNGVAETAGSLETLFDDPFSGGVSRLLRERGGRPMAPLLSRHLARSLGGDVAAMEDDGHSIWVVTLPLEPV